MNSSAPRWAVGRFLLGKRGVESGLVAMGAVTLLGWLLGFRALASFNASGPAVDVESAVALLLAGASLIVARKSYPKSACTLVWGVIAIGLLNLARAVSTALFQFELPSIHPSWSGGDAGMPFGTALCLCLSGFGLFVVQGLEVRQWFRLAAAGGLMALGLASGSAILLGLSFPGVMALPMAGACCWLALLLFNTQAWSHEPEDGYLTALFVGSVAMIGAAAIVMASLVHHVEKAHAVLEQVWAGRVQLEQFGAAVDRMTSAERNYLTTGDRGNWDEIDDQYRKAVSLLTDAEPFKTVNLLPAARRSELHAWLDRKYALIQKRAGGAANGAGMRAAATLFTSDDEVLEDELLTLTKTLIQENDRLFAADQSRVLALVSKGKLLQAVGSGLGLVLVALAFGLTRQIRNRIKSFNLDLDQRVQVRTKELRDAATVLTEQNCALSLSEKKARESEQFVRMILAHSPFVLWAIDPRGVYTLREGKGLRALGSKAGDGVGQLQSEVMKENPLFAEYAQRAMKGEAFSAELNFRGRWINARYSPMKGAGGEVVGVVGVSTDITARKASEQDTINAEGARQASRLKSEFLASMTHEIRTPMNGIVGMAGLLNQTPLSEDQRGMLDVIQNSANSLLAAVNDILDLSKLEAGKLAIDNNKFDLRELIEETLSILSSGAHEKGLELISDFDSTWATELSGDAVRLRQVVNNLVGNGIKFTQRGHVLVRTRLKRASEQRVTVRIDIVDTGIGIAPEIRDQLLVPFVQGERSTARKFGGTGLGLAISKQLIELMGGAIGVSSEVGAGSTFWFELELPQVGGSTVPVAPMLPRGLRVLILDDNEVCRGILALQLSARGAVVDTAADGASALNLCLAKAMDRQLYAVVFVDRYMPGGDGVQFARSIRANPALSETALVQLSPNGTQHDTAAFNGLFQATVSKPVREMQLLRAVSAAIAKDAVNAVSVNVEPPLPKKMAPLSLLVVEDNPVNRRVITTMLRNLGHRFDVAGNGAEALRRLETESYDAVLMDCHMPVLDGYAATRQLRSAQKPWSKVRVIAVTANTTTADRQLCFDSGMDDFVPKPLHMSVLESALSRCQSAEQVIQ